MTIDPARAASSRRRDIPEGERILVWTRAGGCCELCGTYLLEGALTGRPLRAGELAHIVGQGTGSGSPRGQVEMSPEDRDKADNLMLLCRADHRDIDRDGSLDVATIDWLRTKKAAHEERIRHLVSMGIDQGSALLRLIGDVANEVGQIPLDVARSTILRAGRYPAFRSSFDRAGVEIDVRGIPGDADLADYYWTAAMRRIDEGITRLRDGLRTGGIQHVSVFALARIPLLIYLGAQLDDTFNVDVYQRHRSSQGWDWKADPVADFRFDRPAHLAEEALLVFNVTGMVDPAQLGSLAELPRITVSMEGDTGVDAMASVESLANFETTARAMLASLEVPNKVVRRLHVVGALPIAAAVAFGRAHNPPVHPTLVVYSRSEAGSYHPVLEIS